MAFEIVSNVELGKRTANRQLGELQSTLDTLDVGDGIFFSAEEYKDSYVQAASNSANARAKKGASGKKFSSRKVSAPEGRWIVRAE